jgi:hypothetical protein
MYGSDAKLETDQLIAVNTTRQRSFGGQIPWPETNLKE